MRHLRGLRAEILLWIILPLVLILLAVSAGSVALHQNSMRDMVAERDAQVAAVGATRLYDDLHEHELVLQSLLDRAGTVPPADAVLQVGSVLGTFDHGIALLDSHGQALTPMPPLPGDPAQAQALAARALQQPGHVMFDFVPGAGANAGGMIMALADAQGQRVAIGAASPEDLDLVELFQQLASGQYASALLIDTQGKIIYALNPALIGRDMSQHAGVRQVLAGQSGHAYAEDDQHVVGYAPVADTGWGLVLEESWSTMIVPALQYSLLGPLVALVAALASLGAVYFGFRRVIQPLQRLGRQAGRLAWGDFQAIDRPVAGIDEVEELQRTLQEMAGQIHRYQAGMQDYIAALTQTQEDERRRLARELHDETVQSLIALTQRVKMLRLDLEECASCEASPNILRAQERLNEVSDMLDQALGEVRCVIRDLRPIYLDELGLASAVEMLAQTNESRELAASFELTGEERRLTPEAEMAVYRIAQAAVANAVRHGAPSQIDVRLDYAASGVTLTVEDNGRGFVPPLVPSDLAIQGHFGLMGMLERATRLGGHLSIRSAPGQGTTVIAYVPVDGQTV